MATITGYTAAHMQEIEDSTITSGSVNSAGGLILKARNGVEIDAGNVKGPQGDVGPKGNAGVPGGTPALRDSIFGVPTTTVAQVALANQSVGWYNTDTAWFEVYRGSIGMPGLIVPGVSNAPGWYPMGAGPWYTDLPKGKARHNRVVIPAGPVTDAIVSHLPNFQFKGGRKYRIVWDASHMQSSISDLFYWSINLAPVADDVQSKLNLQTLSGRTKAASAIANTAQYAGAITAFYEPTTDTTMTVKFRIQRVVGNGNSTVVGNAGEVAEYMIFDDGTVAASI